jgi:hypothetical protein
VCVSVCVCIYISDTYAHYIAFGLFCAGNFRKDAFPLSPVVRHGLFEEAPKKKNQTKRPLVYLLYWYKSTNTDTVTRQVALTSCAAAAELRACDAKRFASLACVTTSTKKKKEEYHVMRISDARLRREEAPVRAAVHGARVSCGCLHRALRQYLYFVLVKQVN